MKWETLRMVAQAILDNTPSGKYVDKTFSIRSGRFDVLIDVKPVHIGYSDPYSTVANGSTCATHVTIRCRPTHCRDANNKEIFEAENGNLFVFHSGPGSPYAFGYGELKSPSMAAEKPV